MRVGAPKIVSWLLTCNVAARPTVGHESSASTSKFQLKGSGPTPTDQLDASTLHGATPSRHPRSGHMAQFWHPAHFTRINRARHDR
jgi:hypothetical protein